MAGKASTEALDGLAAYRRAEREAYNASDLRLVDNFTEDFTLLSNGVPTLRSRDAAREFFRGLWKDNKARFVEVVDEEVIEFGDYLSVIGHFVLEIIPRSSGAPIIDRGRYHGVFVRDAQTGAYRLWREACVDAGPAATAQSEPR